MGERGSNSGDKSRTPRSAREGPAADAPVAEDRVLPAVRELVVDWEDEPPRTWAGEAPGVVRVVTFPAFTGDGEDEKEKGSSESEVARSP